MADPTLFIPQGLTFETLLSYAPDAPIDLAAFAKALPGYDDYQVEQLNAWIGPQHTCDMILRHHGREGLTQVLRGIAQECSRRGIHMNDRVGAIAGFYEMKVY